MQQVTVLPLRRKASRSDRRDYALGLLNEARDILAEVGTDEANDVVNDLDSAIGDLENVEFPGMYG